MQSTRRVWLAAILFVISGVFAQPCRAQALTAARPSVVTVIVAENVYADIVAQRGGADAAVTSIINQPNQGPHLFEARLLALLTALSLIEAKIAALRANYRGMLITAAEPVLDYLAQAVGLKMRNARFQRALMNGAAPSAADIVAFENDLRKLPTYLIFW